MNPEKYPVIQSNGQRIYFSPTSPRSPPPRGSEIFIGNLPRDLFEDELIPIFTQVGPIYKLRLMMDFSGTTRGFGFITFHSIEDANQAVQRFDKQPIRSKSRTACMSVQISVDNCKLYLGNVPKNKNKEEIETDLKRIVDGIVRIIVFEDKVDPSYNRGFAFAEFETHAMAAIARRKLVSGVNNPWSTMNGNNHELYVDWAEPEPIMDPVVRTQIKILYFKNLPITWSSDEFRKAALLSFLEEDMEILRIYKKDNYAFVHFKEREDAEQVLKSIEKTSHCLVFDGKQIEVEWARPSNYNTKSTTKPYPDTLCTSVPIQKRKIMYLTKKIENMGLE